MNSIKHYLITMFNLRLKWGGVARTDNFDYLINRFDIFEKYTFPSIAAQTCKDFEWVVLFSSSTPVELLARIDGYKNKMSNFTPLFIEDDDAPQFRKKLIEYIERDPAEIVVTTRCDNDDILSTHFIEKIQGNIKEGKKYVLSFPNGYQLDIKTGIMRKYYFPNSHFTTYVSNDTEKTIYDFLHMDIFDNSEVVLVKQEPLWIEVIHDGNVYNTMGSIHYSDYVKEYDLKAEFAIDLHGRMNSFYLFLMYVYFAFRKLYIKRDRIGRYLIRKIKQH